MGLGGKFLVVQRIFAQISPKNSKKTTAFHYIFGTFLSKQSASGTIFAKFSLTCPQNPKKRPPKKRKKRLHFDFGRHHLEISAHQPILRMFSHILHKFPQLLPGFCKDFYKIKTLGSALAPPPPAPMILGLGPLVSPLATPTLPKQVITTVLYTGVDTATKVGGGRFQ